MGLRERINAANDLRREQVEIPQWGITKEDEVYVRTLTGTEKDAFESENFKLKDGDTTFNRQNFRARLVGRCLVDKNNARIFNDQQLAELGARSSEVLDGLSNKIGKLSAMSRKDQEDLLKNSSAGPSAGDGSG